MTEIRGTVEVNDLNRPYWDALAAGRMVFQRCRRCATPWLPARAECPACLATDWAWHDSCGTGRVISWIVYHTAYDESVKDRVPYNVAIVALDEGPRLITNLVEVGNDRIVADARVRLVVERRDGLALACFTPADPGAT